MEIKTKHQLGQTLWTIIGGRAATFVVGVITIGKDGVSYGKSIYDPIPEAQCFETKEELIAYVAGDGD